MNFVKPLSILALCTSLMACAEKQATKTDDAPAETQVEAQAEGVPKTVETTMVEGDVLTITAAKIFPANAPEKALMLAEDGTVSVNGRTIGMLYPDGRMTAADGTLISTLNGDGTVQVADGSTLPMMLMPDGTMVSSDQTKKVFFDGAGLLQGHGKPAGTEIQSEGCASTSARSCMYMLLIMMRADEKAEVVGPAPVKPAKPGMK